VLIDTSTLLRTLQLRHPQYETATRALEILPQQGHALHIVPQNLVELWAVATRPLSYNGLGLTISAALAELDRLKRMFLLLPETPAIYPAWEALVSQYQVSGKPTHDARLVAAMQVHGLTAVLTFNLSDFRRYSHIQAVDPAAVASGAGSARQ
jgi:predicted nucleic acid-binding protein